MFGICFALGCQAFILSVRDVLELKEFCGINCSVKLSDSEAKWASAIRKMVSYTYVFFRQKGIKVVHTNISKLLNPYFLRITKKDIDFLVVQHFVAFFIFL